jgi:hypothetical protein
MGKDCMEGELAVDICEKDNYSGCSATPCRLEAHYGGDKAFYTSFVETCPETWPALHPGWVLVSAYDNCNKDNLQAIKSYPANKCLYQGSERIRARCENGQFVLEGFSLDDEDCLHPTKSLSIPLNTCDAHNVFVTCSHSIPPIWVVVVSCILGVAILITTGTLLIKYVRERRKKATANELELESPEMEDMADDTFDAELSDNDFS